MILTATEKDLKQKLMQEGGFSEKQAEGLLAVRRSEFTETEVKMFTEQSLDIKFAEMKGYLLMQAIWTVLISLAILGWFVMQLDKRNSLYFGDRFKDMKTTMDIKFDAQDRRFDVQDRRFNNFKDSVEARFDKIDSDLNDIKKFIFETRATDNK